MQNISDNRGLLYYYPPKKQYNSTKILAFDLDWTLIQPQIGKIFPENPDDWGFCYSLKNLKKYYKNGYKIVVFTNQSALDNPKSKLTLKDFENRWVDISKKMDVPVYLLMAIKSDFYRKPFTGMWDYLVENLNGGLQVDLKNSIYVGDAAGRPKDAIKRKDYSDSDLKFALNIGINFQSPEEFFNGSDKYPLNDMKDNIKDHLRPEYYMSDEYLKSIKDDNDINWQYLECLFSNEKILKDENLPRVLILVGSPASGKTSFVKKLEDMSNKLAGKDQNKWRFINSDQEGSKSKVSNKAKSYLNQNFNVVIDATHRTIKSRDDWIVLAHQFKAPIWAIYLNADKNLAFHLNKIRKAKVEADPNYESKDVQAVVLHTHFKYFEEPDISEGFQKVLTFNFVPNFKNENDKKIFQTLL